VLPDAAFERLAAAEERSFWFRSGSHRRYRRPELEHKMLTLLS
jgi:hypothetical protein